MSEIIPEIIKDFGDGEVEIKIIATFVYFKPNTSIEDVIADFQAVMDKKSYINDRGVCILE